MPYIVVHGAQEEGQERRRGTVGLSLLLEKRGKYFS